MVQAYSIPKSNRSPNPGDNANLPGPGTYEGEIKNPKEAAPKWSLGGNFMSCYVCISIAPLPLLGRVPDKSLDKVRDLPGPGAYKLTESYDATLRNKNKINFGTSNRPGSSEIKRNIVPGPGSYEQTVEKIKNTGPNYKFGSSNRDKE